MTLIRRNPLPVVVLLVGLFATLGLVSGESAAVVAGNVAGLASVVEDGPVPVMDANFNLGIPARRSLGSSEAAGSAISSIIVLLIVVAIIWCCCTGRCCPGPQVSTAQAAAQNQNVNVSNPVTVNVPEQKPSVQMTTVHHYHGHHAPPSTIPPAHAALEQAFIGSMAAAGASAGNAIAHAQAGTGPPAVDHNTQNHVGGAGVAPPPGHVTNHAQYPPAQGYPVGQTYPPPGPQAQYQAPVSNYHPSPLSNYPPPKAEP